MFTFSTPLRILPPATPPFRSSTSQPGLFTSNERITENKSQNQDIFDYAAIKSSISYILFNDLKKQWTPLFTYKSRLWSEISDWNRYFFGDIFTNCINVVFHLSRYWYDWGTLCNCAWKKKKYRNEILKNKSARVTNFHQLFFFKS